jgi:anaerobic magnesium-protoporphyrin IX monomethyl ester cyclase
MTDDLFLFVRPPRPLWPFNGPGTAFWPPLAFASLAAALREGVPGVRVAILDAPALRMGWASLAREVQRLGARWIGIGEEAVGASESLRVAGLAKQAGASVVAGGCSFGHLAPEVLSTGLVDLVVRGEGETTLVDAVAALRAGEGRALRGVPGLAYRDGEELVDTGWREPIDDLDRLPMPAYDLLPVRAYASGSRNHPALAAIEASRGCAHACDFCVLWRQMGRVTAGRPAPLLRTKSPERLREEIRVLVGRHGRRYLGWVDPCFNADPALPARVSELLLRDGVHVGQSAWVRADHLLRDSASGALETCVRGGLNEVYLGIERTDARGLRALRKGLEPGDLEEAVWILERRHPRVVKVGSFIYGLEGDTAASVRRLYRDAQRLPLDVRFFIPLTPLPGTPSWRPEQWDGTGRALRRLDFLPRTDDARVRSLTRALYASALLSWPRERLRNLARGLTAAEPRRRSIVVRSAARQARFAVRAALAMLAGRELRGMRYPAWYES